MTQGRILPLLGLLLVLYLVLEVASAPTSLDPTAMLVIGVAVLLAAVPAWVLRRTERERGGRRVALLGVALGAALTRFATPDLGSVALDVAGLVGLPAAGGLALHLALDTPDAPNAIASRRRMLLTLLALLVIGGVAGAALSIAPPLELAGELWIVPARWALAAPGAAGLCLLLAFALRLARPRLGSSPEALAAGAGAQIGIVLGLIGLAGAWILASETALGAGPPRWVAIGAAMALAFGHTASLGSARKVHASRDTRRALAGVLTLGGLAAVVASWGDALEGDPAAMAIGACLAVLVAGLGYVALRRVVDRVFAPFGGRLLDGASRALDAAVGATSFEDLGEAVLPPLRLAAGSMEAEPLLCAFDPPREVRIDAAAVAHVEAREPSDALRTQILERPGEIIVAAPLFEQVVRRAELRPLVDALERLDALAVVPLSVDQEPVGALVIGRGARSSALTLEELSRLERLGRHLSGQVSMLSAHERARARTREAVLMRDELVERLETQEEELLRLRADAQTLKAGGAAERYAEPAIAYSPAMRALTRRIAEVGPVQAPVILVGEEGSGVERVGHMLHAASGRRGGPFVVADCAAVRPERSLAALFGESSGPSPGWLRLAEGGTCLLVDAPALSLEAQAMLAEALATRRATYAEGAGGYPFDARVIATSRVELGPLAEAGAFDPELNRRLAPLSLRVPPLRDRREDLASLVLLALDRACRTAARPVLGIDPAAQRALEAHHWPGNLFELRAVIDEAVTRARGAQVRLDDLPPLAPIVAPDPWTGTYAEIEARVLEHAMARASGNKSEAARLLGLARTTFLDKLKRLEPTAVSESAPLGRPNVKKSGPRPPASESVA
ncbi:MAG: sigma 54-interacting transcriptional regulator [Sandaracinaceae bacterium]